MYDLLINAVALQIRSWQKDRLLKERSIDP